MENEKKAITVTVNIPAPPPTYGPEVKYGLPPEDAAWLTLSGTKWQTKPVPGPVSDYMTSDGAKIQLFYAEKRKPRVMYVAIGEGWNGDIYVMAVEPTRQDLNDTLLRCFADKSPIAIGRMEEGRFDD